MPIKISLGKGGKDPGLSLVHVYVDAKVLLSLSSACEELDLEYEQVLGMLANKCVYRGHGQTLRNIKALNIGETCQTYGRKFDVMQARRLVRDREANYRLKIDETVAAYVSDCIDAIDRAYAMSRDLSRPLILVPPPVNSKRKRLLSYDLIDGHHRLYKALVTSREYLPAHLLSFEEAQKIRLDRRSKNGKV